MEMDYHKGIKQIDKLLTYRLYGEGYMPLKQPKERKSLMEKEHTQQEDDASIISKLINVIDLHDKMRGAYFYSSPQKAVSRRNYEMKNSLETEFFYQGHEYKIHQNTSCSCKNVYYKMQIEIDGEYTNKDIRLIKKILAALK